MTKPTLLDVNVLIALFDPYHVHHQIAHDWFVDNRSRGWATCPLTENGFIRVLSTPRPGRDPIRSPDLAHHLRHLCGATDHLFWPETISLLETKRFDLSLTRYKHVTDIYLLAVAQAHDGTLTTFDRSIPYKAVIGATAATLEVVGG